MMKTLLEIGKSLQSIGKNVFGIFAKRGGDRSPCLFFRISVHFSNLRPFSESPVHFSESPSIFPNLRPFFRISMTFPNGLDP